MECTEKAHSAFNGLCIKKKQFCEITLGVSDFLKELAENLRESVYFLLFNDQLHRQVTAEVTMPAANMHEGVRSPSATTVWLVTA